MKRIALILGILLIMSGFAAAADESTHYENEIAYQNADRAIIDIKLGMGELEITRGQGDYLARIVGDYDEEYFDVIVKYEEKGGTGYFTFECKKEKGVKLFKKGDDIVNEWTLLLGDRIPLTIDLDAGMSANTFDLSGLKIEKMSLDIGMSSNNIVFREPNPVVMTDFMIDAGQSSTEIYGLGNANFRNFTIDEGMSSSVLDFTGKLDFEAEVTIDAGMGSIDIILPQNIGLKIKAPSGFTSSLSLPNNLTKAGKNVYENEEYSHSKNRLYFDIDFGMGSVDVKYAKSL